MSYTRKIIKNVFSNWANLLVSLAISFFLAPFILHKIGNTYYGVWALATQVTGYLWLLDFGVRDSVIKYVAEYHGKQNNRMLDDIINASLRMYSMICFVCMAISVALAVLFPLIFSVSPEAIPVAQAVVIITGLDISQAFVFNVFVGVVMGLQRYDVFSKIAIVLSIVRTALTVAFLSRGHGLVTISLIQFLGNSCMYIVLYVVTRRLLSFKLEFWKHGRRKGTYGMLMKYGFFVFLNSVTQQAIFYSANFIIAVFLPISSVTFFAIAANLIEYMKKVIFAGTQVLNPVTSELVAKNESSKIAMVLVQGTKFSLLLGLPVATVYFFMGQQFIGLWMGFEYAAITGNILAILTVMTLFSLPHYTIGGILLGLNKHRIIAYCRLVEAIVNVVLSALLVRRLGILGAALGAAIPHLIMVIVVLPIIISKIVNIKLSEYLRSSYYGPFLSAVPFAMACFLVPFFYTAHSLLLFFGEIVALLPIYVIGIWFLGLAEEERRFFKKRLPTLVPTCLGR